LRRILCPSLALVLFASLAAAAPVPVAITSAGQSADAQMVFVLMRMKGMEMAFDQLMRPEALEGKRALVVVIGGSSKGLGAAGIDREAERDRVVRLLEAAKSRGVLVVALHVGGEARRGPLSDYFAEAVIPFAEHLLVVREGNRDGFLSRLAERSGARLVEVEAIQDVASPLEEVLRPLI